jgi:hypothetical protein
MEPALSEGDWLLFLTFAGLPRAFTRQILRISFGKIVLVRRSADSSQLTVKRLVREYDTGYWVEGDNKEASTDSRHYLTVEADEIVGRFLLRYRAARPPQKR